MNQYYCDPLDQTIEATNMTEAVRIFAKLLARRELGRRGVVATARPDGHHPYLVREAYEITIGVPVDRVISSLQHWRIIVFELDRK